MHFIHNAEFLNDYPGLPTTWARSDVYVAWLAMTAIGGVGALLVYRGLELMGLLLLALYAVLGLDSLGHYVLAPLSAHTAMMNTTILLEAAPRDWCCWKSRAAPTASFRAGHAVRRASENSRHW